MAKAESLVLGGGCFWCLEAVYQPLRGIVRVVPGYSGGSIDNPSYEQVCTGTTGHAEVVKLTYDPSLITLTSIMAVFWATHDPTSLNRQGADAGTQYASIVFYENEQQRTLLEASKAEAGHLVTEPIVTRIEPLTAFYEAEPEHHNYYLTHPEAAYCAVVIEPKLVKLRQHFAALLAS
jgi:peptide-methionine (S)-S-oxide reductase